MLSKSSRPAEVRASWDLAELQALESLLTDPRFRKFIKWQAQMEESLSERIWSAKTFDEYRYLCGQHETAKRFDPDRMIAELRQLKETLSNEMARQ